MYARAFAISSLFVLSLLSEALASEPTLFIVHFETGPAWDMALAPAEQPGFKAHSANLNQLRSDGAIAFGARYGELGLIVLRAESLASATALLEADPGVVAKIFTFRIDELNVFYPWKP